MDVRLRPVRDEDLPVLFAHQADRVAAEMAGFPSRDEEAFRAHWRRLKADPGVVTAVAEVDGSVAGWLGSWAEDGRRYLGYWFGRAFWGRGVATEALRRFLEGFEERPLFAHVVVHNAGSMQVLAKCGFVEVGRDDEEVLFELTRPTGPGSVPPRPGSAPGSAGTPGLPGDRPRSSPR